MLYSESLKKNKDFQRVYRSGKSYANRLLIMYALQNDALVAGTRNRLGISVSKKVGNSVVRHHLTRLIREGYRLNEEKFKGGYDFVVIARPAAKEKSYHEIEDALLHLAKLQKVLNTEKKDIDTTV
ncbi:MAG: ribonuclease P protein component [Eubacteriales bacterium]|nr:ribonuclease P protein component [Eubacteriales bacterium]